MPAAPHAAGTFMIMFYDMWHRATSSTADSDMHLAPVDRDPTDTRWSVSIIHCPRPGWSDPFQ